MIKSPKTIFKLFLSFFLAFLVSQILVTKVTFRENPILRPSFQQTVHNLPTKIVDQIRTIVSFPKRFFTQPQNPPPWIEPVIKPTIVAYKPPIYYPPTSTPKNPQPTATPSTPLPTPTPGYGPTPTQSPYNSPAPTNPPTPTTPPIMPTPTPTSPADLPPSQKKSQLLDLINQERQKNNTAAIGYNSALNNASQAHAEDMYQNNYFNRDHSGRDGSSPSDRAERAGYGSRWVGENAAKGTTDPNSVFSMWMGSSGHRQNMLNPTWKSAGIGLGGNIWVLMLGAK